MAGAGKKTFVAGEVLTAAQVNDYLMDQAVMRFSGSAARAASITAPTEGMVTYLDDANAIELYNGAAWVRLESASAYAANYTAKGQILVGTGSGTFVAQALGTDGQYLAASSGASDGVAWVTPAAGAAGAWANITTASTFTAMTSSLAPGFYKISTNSSLSFTSAEFRFATSGSALYGASLTNGAGFFSLPVAASFINVTQGAPMTVLIEEVPSLTAALPVGPTIANLDIVAFTQASYSATTIAGAQGIGFWQLNNGSFNSLAASVTTASFISAISASPTSVGAVQNFAFVQRASNGLWGTATTASARWPFQVFTSSSTYTVPSWATKADLVIVAGGGAGGWSTATGAGAGGAGGVLYYTNVPVTGSYSFTIGAGGARGAIDTSGSNGGNTTFNASVATGGGRGGPNGVTGAAGGSGGGGGHSGNAGGAGTAGQGNSGGTASGSQDGGGGGGYSSAGVVGTTTPSGGTGLTVFGLVLAGGGGGINDNTGYGYPGAGQESFGGGGNAGYGATFNPAEAGKNGAVIVRSRA